MRAAQVDVRMLPLLDGGWSEALRQQCFADPYLSGKFLMNGYTKARKVI